MAKVLKTMFFTAYMPIFCICHKGQIWVSVTLYLSANYQTS